MACNGSSQRKKPGNLIPKDQMSQLLYDLYVINAAKGVNKRTLETNGFNPETYILTKYNIDSTQFADSNAYYTLNTDVYKAIVDKVKARLEAEKQEFDEINKRENDSIKKRRDSINAIRKTHKSKNKKLRDTMKTIIDTPKIIIDTTTLKKLKPKRLLGKVDSLRQ